MRNCTCETLHLGVTVECQNGHVRATKNIPKWGVWVRYILPVVGWITLILNNRLTLHYYAKTLHTLLTALISITFSFSRFLATWVHPPCAAHINIVSPSCGNTLSHQLSHLYTTHQYLLSTSLITQSWRNCFCVVTYNTMM